MISRMPYIDWLGVTENNKFVALEEKDTYRNKVMILNSLKDNESILLTQGEQQIERTKLSWILMAKHRLLPLDSYKDCIPLYRFVKTNVKKMSTDVGNGNDYVILFKMPIYVKEKNIEKDRFILIPEFPKYGIDNNGIVVDICTGNTLPVLYKNSTIKDAYPSVRLLSSASSSIVTRSIHKLMGVTWVENDDWDRNTIISFKDGDKNNYKASNLEWTTLAGKSISNGDTKSSAIKVFDYTLKETNPNNQLIFDSLAEVFKYLKKTMPNGIKTRMISNGGFEIINRRYEVRFLNDNRDFILKTKDMSEVLDKIDADKFSKKFYAKNINTGEAKEGTASELDKALSKHNGYVLNLKKGKLIKEGWLVVDIEDRDKDIDISLFREPSNKPKRIRTEDLKTGEVKIHDSVIQATNYIIAKSKSNTTKKTVGKQASKSGIVHNIKIELV